MSAEFTVFDDHLHQTFVQIGMEYIDVPVVVNAGWIHMRVGTTKAENLLNMKALKTFLVGSMLLSLPICVQAITVDILNVGDSGSLNGAIFSGDSQHSGGTGIFSPFLSLQAPGNETVERAYNAGNGNLYMDNTRPSWNSQLHIGDLQRVDVGGLEYFLFTLDANEPGNNKSFISIDNIRIYTSSSDTSPGLDNDLGTTLDSLGTLRYSMNDPLRNAKGDYIIDNWVNLDSRLDAEPAGSGLYDMFAYIPVTAFTGVPDTDFLWFYNLNGVHYAADGDLAAQSGFEEWRALTGPNEDVPDGGATLLLLGLAFASLSFVRSRTDK